MKIAYFVHNVDDAAVLKRIQLLRQGKIEVELLGFTRFSDELVRQRDVSTFVIGRSEDGKFVARILIILRTLFWPFGLISRVKDCDAFLCRNLEMLVLGFAIRTLAGSSSPLTYECLDIHRKLLGPGIVARSLRRLERFLMGHCETVMTSSPGFVRNYFHAVQGYQGEICLMENKVLSGAPNRTSGPVSIEPEWTIGWFGIIRCRKSLEMLDQITRSVPSLKLIISGRVAYQEFPDFDGIVSANPRIRYTGPFTPDALAEIYGRVHFVWAIDYYEEGDNSTWLLPNRLYDSLAFGAVPIALSAVETGHWLTKRGAGLVISDPLRDLPPIFANMTLEVFESLKSATRQIPLEDIFHDQASVDRLMTAILPKQV